MIRSESAFVVGILLFVVGCQSLAHAELIPPPTLEGVRQQLSTDDEDQIERGLLLVQMYDLPLADEVERHFDFQYPELAYCAYLAAGGSETKLVQRLQGLIEAGVDDGQRSLATALLCSREHSENGLRALLALAFSGIIEPCDVFDPLGGELSVRSVELLLEQFAKQQLELTGDFLEWVPVAPHLKLQHWPGLRRLLSTGNEELRFLAAAWTMLGDLDELPEDQVALLLAGSERERICAAVLKLRREPQHAECFRILSEAFQSADLRVQQLGILGVGTLPNDMQRWLPLLLPYLRQEQSATSWLAVRLILHSVAGHAEEIVADLQQHLNEIPATFLYDVILHFREQEVPALQKLSLQLVSHPHRKTRKLAIESLSAKELTPQVFEVLLEQLKDESPDFRFDALRLLARMQPDDFQRQEIDRATKLLLSDASSVFGARVRDPAAALRWQLTLDREGLLTLARDWLSSKSVNDVNCGIEFMRSLQEESAPFLDQLFELAGRDGRFHSRLVHVWPAFGPKGRHFLLQKLKSPTPQDRGQALELLVGFPADDELVQTTISLLADENHYESKGLFGGVNSTPIGLSAAMPLYYWRNWLTPQLARDLQVALAQSDQLKSMLPFEMSEWLQQPLLANAGDLPGEGRACWIIADRLTHGALQPEDPKTLPLSPALLREYLQLVQKTLPSGDTILRDGADFAIMRLDSVEIVDDSVVEILQRWVKEVPVLELDLRVECATQIRHCRPDDKQVQQFLELRSRVPEIWSGGVTILDP
ncbi:HEAT repeat domain-containing protein [Planctomicrobium sp. SH664]|uniref:HEAT repeat domain-containing protein n=1 Tax=Planctomicrobium sp. SH664 TaxID=3448125 RepID=UPI003F5BE204